MPKELQILNLLHTRLDLPEETKQYYLNKKKGYEGELKFDQLVSNLQNNYFALNGLLLKHNNTLFEIDSLLIMGNGIKYYEIKNFQGNYYFESDKIYFKPEHEIMNPLNQLNRSESLFRQLLQSYGFNINIESYIVFINPELTLYQAPINKQFILPTQLKQHFAYLESIKSRIGDKHKLIGEKLASLHIEESPHSNVPEYKFEELRKGIVCKFCNSFNVNLIGQKCFCQDCENVERAADAIKRTIDEFRLLFPDERVTARGIYYWCNGIASLNRIRDVLSKHFIRKSNNRWTYYE